MLFLEFIFQINTVQSDLALLSISLSADLRSELGFLILLNLSCLSLRLRILSDILIASFASAAVSCFYRTIL